MSKSKSAKRKRTAQAEATNKAQKIITPPPDSAAAVEPKNVYSFLSEEELQVTIETLQTLTENPDLIKSKACKDLRVAVYDFRQACTTGINTAADTNLTARISAALTDCKYTTALILLAEMRIRGEAPKLGALCRWVRDLDVVSGLSMQAEGTSHQSTPRSDKDRELLRVLDAILRVTGPTDTHAQSSALATDPIALQDAWSLRNADVPAWQIRQSVLDGSIFTSCPTDIKDKFRVIETTTGPLRKPPNLHPAILHTSAEDAIVLSANSPDITRVAHPTVPNLSVIQNVLSTEECTTIVAAAETVGFTPDAPIRDDGEDTSVLAHNFYWVVDQAFHDKLWARVSPFVPQSVGGRLARGINRRFRVYRYVPGAEYRCHIGTKCLLSVPGLLLTTLTDGAWPPSGIDAATDTYKYDASPPEARQSSLFTFLIYLNDCFEAGETTYFIPSASEGIMNAYPVKPVMGSVAVFPHGEAKGALLHEGTGVRKGAKYIIRTDVEYDVDATV